MACISQEGNLDKHSQRGSTCSEQFTDLDWSHQINIQEHICIEVVSEAHSTLFYSTSLYLSYALSSWFPLVLVCLKISNPLKTTHLLNLWPFPDMLSYAGWVWPGPWATQTLSHSFGAFWAAAPQEVIGKNQFSLLWPGKSQKTGMFGSPGMFGMMSHHFCAPPIYMNAKNYVLNVDLSIPEAWCLGPLWLWLSSSRKQALED